MLRGFILSVHIVLALMIIGLVLMQRGKGAEAGAGFGSGASGTVFGARGTATWNRTMSWCAVTRSAFMPRSTT